MSTVQFITDSEKKYQPYDEIKEQYSGYVVCLVKCNAKKTGRIFGGEVLAYADSLSPLMRETAMVTRGDDAGVVAYKSFKSFPDVSNSSIYVVEEYD
ncbi:MAG: hypothetical protein FWD90_12705 [Defluviitaleaceae bacterium]|nr:hypothetical protein [Defluviitaleaceae bacterium]